MKRFIVALALAVGVWPNESQAAPIFFDNFNGENGGTAQLNFTAFNKWSVGPGDVDLSPLPPGGDGPYDFLGDNGLSGHGLYVDLDGTSNAPGLFQLKNAIDLGPGQYDLKFFLTGNLRDWAADIVALNIFSSLNSFSYYSSTIARNANDIDVFTIPFVLGWHDSIKFSFLNSGADFRGALLDDVELSR